MYEINQLDIISFVIHEMSFTLLMHCNNSEVRAVSPENVPGEMNDIELSQRALHSELDSYESDDDCR